MAAAKPTAAAKAAVSASAASEDKTPATTGEAAENAAVAQSGPILEGFEDDGLIAVVVLPRNTLRHEGQKHRQHSTVRVSAHDADRLIKRGVVVTREQALEDALTQEGVTVTQASLVKISQV
jgi:hypothetical protein